MPHKHKQWTLLDGGMGHLLKMRGSNVDGLPVHEQFVAGVLANVRNPDIVVAAHRDYISSGADVITTNNFAATPYHLSRLRVTPLDAPDHLALVQAAATCAQEAVRQSSTAQHVRIAASLPPLKESYLTAGLYSDDEARQLYSDIARTAAPSVDLLLCETLSSVSEALAATAAAAATGLPVWLSYTLEDSTDRKLRDGTALADALATHYSCPTLSAVLVNCCAPHAVAAAMPLLCNTAWQNGWQCGGYGNCFKTTTSEWLKGAAASDIDASKDEFDDAGYMTAACYARYGATWLSHGADILGGCCGTSPQHIAALAALRSDSDAVA